MPTRIRKRIKTLQREAADNFVADQKRISTVSAPISSQGLPQALSTTQASPSHQTMAILVEKEKIQHG